MIEGPRGACVGRPGRTHLRFVPRDGRCSIVGLPEGGRPGDETAGFDAGAARSARGPVGIRIGEDCVGGS